MKRGFQKSLALLLAVFMTFGAIPFFAVGMIASAQDPEDLGELKSISISPDSIEELVVGDTKNLQVSGAYKKGDNITSRAIDAKDILWSTDDDKVVSVSSEGVITGVAPSAKDQVVTITALEKDSKLTAECKIMLVKKAPIFVDTILWDWDVTALLAGTGKEYSFAKRFKVIPDNADVQTAKLSCSPAGALQIDNEKQTFKVNPITTDKLVITLTLTADGASDKCKPVDKQVTVYNDVPLTSIAWDYAVGTTGKTLFKYYETISGIKQIAEYYYMTTDGKNTTYKYHTVPAYAIDLCEITVSSADKRIVTFDEETKRLIPVGNGETQITVTAKTPKGQIRSHTIIAVVQDSPYTPVKSVAIGYDKDKTDSDATYDTESNTLTLMYTHVIQLTANLNTGAKLDQKAISVTMNDGRKVKTVAECEYSWKSSDENVATVDKTGKVTVTGAGTATITLTINDNGTKFTKEVKIKGTMTWWEALVGIFMSIFSGNWNKVPVYFKALFSGIF